MPTYELRLFELSTKCRNGALSGFYNVHVDIGPGKARYTLLVSYKISSKYTSLVIIPNDDTVIR